MREASLVTFLALKSQVVSELQPGLESNSAIRVPFSVGAQTLSRGSYKIRLETCSWACNYVFATYQFISRPAVRDPSGGFAG